MKFTLTVVALFSVLCRADAALRNSNALVITSSDESESSHDTPKPAEDTHSFLSEKCNWWDPKCVGKFACGWGADQVDQSKVGCGSCVGTMACNRYTGDSIGENSCSAERSCAMATATIGKNSCNGVLACYGASGYIPDNQCNSEDECKDKYHHSADFPALYLYKDVLTGFCLSSLGKTYTDVRIESTYLSKNSPEVCAQFCRQPSLDNGFQVGMQFASKRCFCLYDGIGELPSLVPYNTGKVIKEGEGPVARSTGNKNPGLTCYPLKDVNIAHHSVNEPTLTID